MKTTATFIILLFGALALSTCTLLVPVEEPPDSCQDGVLDDWEECDQELLGGETCVTLGYKGGTLSCTPECDFNTAACTNNTNNGTCGDGQIDTGEECDGSNLNGANCESLGYGGGNLSCKAECYFDLTACESVGVCGDGTVNPGEECDGEYLPGGILIGACTDWGFSNGDGTAPNCIDCQLDFSNCTPYNSAGTGVGMPCETDANECTGFSETLQPECTDGAGLISRSICTASCTLEEPDVCRGSGGVCEDFGSFGKKCMIPCETAGTMCPSDVGTGDYMCTQFAGLFTLCLPQ